jgi:hypothetical protein
MVARSQGPSEITLEANQLLEGVVLVQVVPVVRLLLCSALFLINDIEYRIRAVLVLPCGERVEHAGGCLFLGWWRSLLRCLWGWVGQLG